MASTLRQGYDDARRRRYERQLIQQHGAAAAAPELNRAVQQSQLTQQAIRSNEDQRRLAAQGRAVQFLKSANDAGKLNEALPRFAQALPALGVDPADVQPILDTLQNDPQGTIDAWHGAFFGQQQDQNRLTTRQRDFETYQSLSPEERAQYDRLYGVGNKAKPAALPANIQEWQMYERMSPEQKAAFLNMKRAGKVVDINGVPTYVQSGPEGGASTNPLSDLQSEAAAAQQLKAAEAFGSALGKARGELTAEDLPQSERSARRAASNLKNQQARIRLTTDTIDRAIDQTNILSAGIAAGRTQLINPWSKNLAASLDTIKAVIGFEELDRMRAASKTGGALGNVTVREIELLQAVLGNLEQTQTPEQLVSNLQRAKQEIAASWARIEEAYEQDYGVKYTPGATPPKDAKRSADDDLLRKYGVID